MYHVVGMSALVCCSVKVANWAGWVFWGCEQVCHSSPKSHSVIQYSLQRLNAGYGCAVVGLSRDRARGMLLSSSVSLSGIRTIIRCKDFMGDLTSAPARELEYLCSFQVTLPCTQPPQFARRWCAHVPYVCLMYKDS
jgi:hypothetical protein